jgi:hypothetical protein
VRVFLDANILFSASNPKWLTGLLLEVLAGHGELVTSEFAIGEARRNVAGFCPDLLDGLEAWVNRVQIVSGAGLGSHRRNLRKKIGRSSMRRLPVDAPTS